MNNKEYYTEEEADRAVAFVRHIERHSEVQQSIMHTGKAVCKICHKDIDTIAKEYWDSGNLSGGNDV